MKHVASCSFGKDSMATIILALENKEPIDLVLYAEVMFDEHVSGEIPEHAAFIYEKAIPRIESWGIPVQVVRSSVTYKSSFFQIIKRSSVPERIGKYRGFPIPGRCCINRDCKVAPIRKFLKDIPREELVQYVGIAADERKRLERLDGIHKTSLLDRYHVTEKEAMEICRENGLLSPIYEFTTRGGCWFCPNCRAGELRHLATKHPELLEKLKELDFEKNRVSLKFNRTETLEEIYRRISSEVRNGKE